MPEDSRGTSTSGFSRRTIIGAGITGMGTGLAGCTDLLGAGAESTDLRIGLSRPPANLDPFEARDPAARLIVGQIFESLYEYTRRLEVIPVLAAGPPAVSRDGHCWTIPIADSARWPDGTPVTAADVVATVQQARERGAFTATQWGMVDEVRAVDTSTIRFDLLYPYGGFAESLFSPILPAHAVDREPWTSQTTRDGLGSGPYTYDGRTEAGAVRLRKRDSYWGDDPPSPETIEFPVYTDDTRRLVALRGREIDAATDVPAAVWSTIEDVDALSFKAVPGYRYTFLGCNCKAGPTRDVDVRQALAHLIDVDAVVESTLGESATRVFGPLPHPVSRAWEFDRRSWRDLTPDRDVEAAGRLLHRSPAVSETWEATFLVPPDDARGTACNAIAQGLIDLGYGATVREVDWPAFRRLRLSGDPETYNVYCGGIMGRRDPDSVLYPLFGPAASGVTEGTYYRAAEDAIVRGRRGESRSARQEAYATAMQRILEDVAHIPLYTRRQSVARRQDVTTVTPHPTEGADIDADGPTDVADPNETTNRR